MIMKRNIYLLFALWVFSANVGCTTNFDEINRNPNEMDEGAISPTGMLQETLYTGAEVLLYRTWQLNGELIQYTVSGTGNNSFHRYVITNSVMESAWSNLFKWAANAEAMRRLAVDQQNVNCEAVAITLKTLYLSNLTDMFGEIPCSEAFRGSGENLTKPRFDTQRAVYEQLLADLEYANSIYDTSVAMSSAQRDLLYGGDMMKWRKFNNSLYLRLLMRLSNRDREMGIAARVRAVFEDSAEWPVFTSNDDNATFYYDEVNPFVNYFGNILESAFTTTGRRPAEQIIGMMDAPGDPRISIWFKQASGYDGWKGAESGKEAQESDNSGVSLLNKANLGDYASPYSHMKYDEVLFIFAEAIKRGWIDGGDALAEQYYNDAVRASIRFWSDVNKTGNPVSESTVERFLANIPYDGTLESILDQKYVALFWTGFEAWHEYRRTGYPALVIGEGTQNDHVLPTRMAYPTIAIKTNPDNYAAEVARLQSVFHGADDMKTPVWWSAEAVRKGIE